MWACRGISCARELPEWLWQGQGMSFDNLSINVKSGLKYVSVLTIGTRAVSGKRLPDTIRTAIGTEGTERC
jgi:hypothetical protein